ncbi:MAG: hypothetical protein IPH07_13175 [Deltaproteobacteria bacterium]|jgi:hypothetical protein|nr:hypothetical protein [Deltaproteobacteria bacterium]MBK8241107.1 hypothetical protein [Deltaproteobacteria bacterium]MBK8716972.1 hypothetical protein [Deltaproteobacteria bacterium]MBP7292367.1 hypothetical protein [Nannocystaceae bacterium]
MKRTFVTTTFTLALLGVAACKGGGADSAKLIPDAATMVGGIDVKALVGSKAYADNKEKIETGEFKEMVDAATACNLGTDKWKSIAFGADPTKKQFAVIISADGIGKDENLTCIQGKIKEKQGKDPWTVEEKDGKKTLTMDDGVGYIVNEGSLVVASKDWAGAVKDLIDGKGKSVFDGSLKETIGRANTGKHIWFAGTLPADMIKGSPADGAKDVAGSLDLSGGIAIDASVGFASADEATKKKDELQKQFEGVKGMAGTVGVPQSVVDSVKIDASGNAVTVSAKASDDDLKKISETVGK